MSSLGFYKGHYLFCDKLCEPCGSQNKQKSKNDVTVNCIINKNIGKKWSEISIPPCIQAVILSADKKQIRNNIRKNDF